MGFSDGEIYLYLRLLELGEATISESLRGLDISRPHAYTLIKILLRKGLVAEIPGKPARFRVLPPEEAFTGLSAKRLNEIEEEKIRIEEALALVKIRAQAMFEKVELPSEVDIEIMTISGYNNVAEWAVRFYNIAKEEFRLITAKPSVVEVFLEKPENAKTSKQKPLKMKMIIDEKMLSDKSFRKYLLDKIAEGSTELRTMKEIPIELGLYDDVAGISVLDAHIKARDFYVLLVKSKEMMRFFAITYDCCWSKAKPVKLKDLT